MLIAGIVVVAVGLLIVWAGFVVNSTTTTLSVPAGSAWTVSPNTVSAVSIAINWFDGTTATVAWVISGVPSCSNPSGVVVQGSGISGAFLVTLQPGTTYSIYACSGSSFQTVTFSLHAIWGITAIGVLGMALVPIGAILLIFALRGRKEIDFSIY